MSVRRQNFRPRPIDLHKDLRLVRATTDLMYEDENGTIQRISSVDAESIGMSAPKRKKLNIPMPPVIRVEDPEGDALHLNFDRPSIYIRVPKHAPWVQDEELL